MSDQQPSTTRRIIGQAVSDLREHTTKLEVVHERVSGELDEARAFIKAAEKVFGRRDASPRDAILRNDPPALGRLSGTGVDSPRGRFTQKVIDLVADEPRSVQSIADHFGSSVNFVRSVVLTAHNAGALKLDGHVVSAAKP